MNRKGKDAAVACGQDYNNEKSQWGNEDVHCSAVGSLCICGLYVCLPECVEGIN